MENKTTKAPVKGEGTTVKGLTAFNVRTRTKDVPILDPEIVSVKSRGGERFAAKGHDKDGTTLTAFISKDKAMEAIKNGAKKKF